MKTSEMVSVTESKVGQVLAAAALTQHIRHKLNLTKPHDMAQGAVEEARRMGIDPVEAWEFYSKESQKQLEIFSRQVKELISKKVAEKR